MLVKLLRDARVTAHAGDTVDVSPAEAGFLLSLGVGEAVEGAAPATTESTEETSPSALRAATSPIRGGKGGDPAPTKKEAPKGARGATGKPTASKKR